MAAPPNPPIDIATAFNSSLNSHNVTLLRTLSRQLNLDDTGNKQVLVSRLTPIRANFLAGQPLPGQLQQQANVQPPNVPPMAPLPGQLQPPLNILPPAAAAPPVIPQPPTGQPAQPTNTPPATMTPQQPLQQQQQAQFLLPHQQMLHPQLPASQPQPDSGQPIFHFNQPQAPPHQFMQPPQSQQFQPTQVPAQFQQQYHFQPTVQQPPFQHLPFNSIQQPQPTNAMSMDQRSFHTQFMPPTFSPSTQQPSSSAMQTQSGSGQFMQLNQQYQPPQPPSTSYLPHSAGPSTSYNGFSFAQQGVPSLQPIVSPSPAQLSSDVAALQAQFNQFQHLIQPTTGNVSVSMPQDALLAEKQAFVDQALGPSPGTRPFSIFDSSGASSRPNRRSAQHGRVSAEQDGAASFFQDFGESPAPLNRLHSRAPKSKPEQPSAMLARFTTSNVSERIGEIDNMRRVEEAQYNSPLLASNRLLYRENLTNTGVLNGSATIADSLSTLARLIEDLDSRGSTVDSKSVMDTLLGLGQKIFTGLTDTLVAITYSQLTSQRAIFNGNWKPSDKAMFAERDRWSGKAANTAGHIRSSISTILNDLSPEITTSSDTFSPLNGTWFGSYPDADHHVYDAGCPHLALMNQRAATAAAATTTSAKRPNSIQPVCYYCNTPGHVITHCPQRSRESTGQQMPTTGRQPRAIMPASTSGGPRQRSISPRRRSTSPDKGTSRRDRSPPNGRSSPPRDGGRGQARRA